MHLQSSWKPKFKFKHKNLKTTQFRKKNVNSHHEGKICYRAVLKKIQQKKKLVVFIHSRDHSGHVFFWVLGEV